MARRRGLAVLPAVLEAFGRERYEVEAWSGLHAVREAF